MYGSHLRNTLCIAHTHSLTQGRHLQSCWWCGYLRVDVGAKGAVSEIANIKLPHHYKDKLPHGHCLPRPLNLSTVRHSAHHVLPTHHRSATTRSRNSWRVMGSGCGLWTSQTVVEQVTWTMVRWCQCSFCVSLICDHAVSVTMCSCMIVQFYYWGVPHWNVHSYTHPYIYTHTHTHTHTHTLAKDKPKARHLYGLQSGDVHSKTCVAQLIPGSMYMIQKGGSVSDVKNKTE